MALAVVVATEVQTHYLPRTMAEMTRPQPLSPSGAALRVTAMIVSLLASVVLLVFDVSPPVRARERFDRPAAPGQGGQGG